MSTSTKVWASPSHSPLSLKSRAVYMKVSFPTWQVCQAWAFESYFQKFDPGVYCKMYVVHEFQANVGRCFWFRNQTWEGQYCGIQLWKKTRLVFSYCLFVLFVYIQLIFFFVKSSLWFKTLHVKYFVILFCCEENDKYWEEIAQKMWSYRFALLNLTLLVWETICKVAFLSVFHTHPVFPKTKYSEVIEVLHSPTSSCVTAVR